jgi:BMFP domain-containing protein YqiC
MQKDSKFFEDMARMASSATGALFDAKREVESVVAAQMERWLLKANIVQRDELDALRAQVEALREEVAALKESKAKKTANKE